ncbi:MAG: cytochrome c biogenesis protein CcsA [Deltaproteobacteria bacterium]|nr:cytochrome c biogenesis protein CcsA [Deltaproteobacteria bacterium]
MYSIPLTVALAMYGLSTVLYLLFFAGLSPGIRKWARLSLWIAAIVHLAAIGYHHVSGLKPHILAPQSLLNLAVFVTIVVFLVVTRKMKTTGIGGILAPIAVVVLGTLINNAGVQVARVEFVSYVTPIHIAASAVGFLFFGLAFCAAFLRILADMRLKDRGGMGWPRLPPIAKLDRYAYGALRIGFPFYTIGIVLGAVWAFWKGGGGGPGVSTEYLMGVGVWGLYATLIFLSAATGWKGRRAAVLIIVGFLATLSIVLMYMLRALERVA